MLEDNNNKYKKELEYKNKENATLNENMAALETEY